MGRTGENKLDIGIGENRWIIRIIAETQKGSTFMCAKVN